MKVRSDSRIANAVVDTRHVKIAITSLYLPSGSKIGVGYQVHHLANQFVRRGHEVVVFSQCGPSPDSLYRVAVVPPRKSARTFGFAWDLRRCDLSGFDVLNAHGDDWFLWGRRRPRHVHTFHGSCLAEALHIRGAKERARMLALAACEYGACLLADELVCVSENTRRYVPAARRVIPNGVDTEVFRPGPKADAPSVLFVGTMHGRKRGNMLRDIFIREVAPAVPGAELWMVCETPVEGVGVRWFGRVPLAQLADLYRRSWVFCLPSSYEGFGIPYVEAMASGTAVVATPNVGAIEVTGGGAFGLLAEDDRLGEKLIDVLTCGRRREALAQSGLKRSRDFDWNCVCSAYEGLYARKGC